MDRVPMTLHGFRKLKEQLRQLKEVERGKNVREIEEARAHGDLSENAEYHAAKDRQGLIDVQIRDLEDKVGRAQVIDPATLSGDKVVFGATVCLELGDSDEEIRYQIVGVDEADPKEGRISVASPLGKALIGKRVADCVVVKTPGGNREYEITSIVFE
jgi:transcription elongation factor GreA